LAGEDRNNDAANLSRAVFKSSTDPCRVGEDRNVVDAGGQAYRLRQQHRPARVGEAHNISVPTGCEMLMRCSTGPPGPVRIATSWSARSR
jgi:hypothetical protein